MSESTRMYWLYALSPVHVGSGQGLGFIDLPIAREKVTNWPFVPGSAMKGVLRDHFSASLSQAYLAAAFGKGGDQQDRQGQSGSVVMTDAHMVFLPIRSIYGTFAYATSPLALSRLDRDMGFASSLQLPKLEVSGGNAICPPLSVLIGEGRVYLEDLDFAVIESGEITQLVDVVGSSVFGGDERWAEIFSQRVVVVPDDSFSYLCDQATEVAARIRIDPDKKVVEEGALWYEEYLPAETILAGMVWCDQVYGSSDLTPSTLIDQICSEPLVLNVGGMQTTGRGRVRIGFSPCEGV